MLPHLSEIPFFRILVALAIGIASSYFSLFPSLAWWYWLLPIFIFSVSYFYRHALPYSQRWLLGLSVQISIALSGFILTSQFYSPNNRTDISHHHTGYTIVRITEAPSIKPKSINIYAATISNINNDTASTCTGNVFLRLPKTKAALELQYGEVLLVKNTFKPVNKPSNPGTFDFGYYLLSKNIQEVSYTDSNAWQSLGLGYQNLLFTWAYKVSNKALTAYKEFLPDTSSRSIVEALCIGERSELSPDINQAFIDTGTIHILSVSGMHVGLFFLVLTWGFARLLPKRELAWLSTLCILCVLWFYALLSGFSAPVIRATMMCTIVALGKLINRKGNVINTLCLSACIQLIINPFSLFDIGFQLSYMAVLSITVLTPGMLAWYSSQNKIIHTAYAACVVALAAQFGTLPLILYYFHRFPTYFLPANLATIAISNFIICGGLVLFVFSFIPSIAYLIGLALNLSSKLLLAILNYISHLPHATANEIFCNKVLFIAIFIVLSLIIKTFI